MRTCASFALFCVCLNGSQRNVLGFVAPPNATGKGACSTSRSTITSSSMDSFASREGKRNPTRLFLDGEGMAGKTFNKHLLGDILRALQPRYLDQVKNTISENLKGSQSVNVEGLRKFIETSKHESGPPPTWEELEAQLSSQQSSNQKTFRSRLEQGLEHSPLASFRVFDIGNKNEETPKVQVTFYKDSASWCPYCQKVWMALEEKQIPYKVIKVDMNCYAGGSKPSSFLELQPSGSLPCAVIHDSSTRTSNEDKVIAQSDDILTILDNLNLSNSVPTLLPNEGTEEEEYMKFLCDDGRNSLERRLYGEWMWYLTGKRKPVEYRERYEAVLTEVNEELGRFPGPFFMGGTEPSMADIKFAPFLERQSASLLYFKGYIVRDETKFPNLCQWFDAMESRPSYMATKSDVYTHSRALPPQLGGNGCTYGEGHEMMKEAVDAYCLPTNESKNVSNFALDWREEGWTSSSSVTTRTRWAIPGSNQNLKLSSSKREAAERIMKNHESICKFAARGAGTAGFPPASAELADPKAVSNEVIQLSVDVFLRYTIALLLAKDDRSNEEVLKSIELAVDAMVGDADTDADADVAMNTVLATIDCLDYLRQRVGVPRDMSYPAAHELRQALLEVSLLVMNRGSSIILKSTANKYAMENQ